MDIKLANCCGNCDHHIKGQLCNVHEIITAETKLVLLMNCVLC